jgi:hypothetical protein
LRRLRSRVAQALVDRPRSRQSSIFELHGAPVPGGLSFARLVSPCAFSPRSREVHSNRSLRLDGPRGAGRWTAIGGGVAKAAMQGLEVHMSGEPGAPGPGVAGRPVAEASPCSGWVNRGHWSLRGRSPEAAGATDRPAYIGRWLRPRRRPSAVIQSSTAISALLNPAGKLGTARQGSATTICERAITAEMLAMVGQ